VNDSAELLYSVDAGIATITLNRPARRNAFTIEMVNSWADRLVEAGADSAVGCILVTGSGGAFCSGVDLENLALVDASPLGRKTMLTDNIHRVARALDDIDKPVIAVLRGVAVGAGLDMALMCDMRLADDTIRLAETYINVGLVPGDGGSWLLPRIVGTAKAMELLFTADFIDARTALELHLVNQVYPPAELDSRAQALAQRIVALPPVQARMIKRLVRQAERIDFRTHLDLVSSHFGVISSLDDYAEAQQAFAAGRPGRFTGR
jgi:enoyl-CoA hydratase/carnithine racemase